MSGTHILIQGEERSPASLETSFPSDSSSSTRCFQNPCGEHRTYLRSFVNCRFPGPIPKESDSVELEPGLRVCILMYSSSGYELHGQGNIIWDVLRSPTAFPGSSAGKESASNAADLGLIPGLGRSPGEGKGYPLQYSGLENSMDCMTDRLSLTCSPMVLCLLKQ